MFFQVIYKSGITKVFNLRTIECVSHTKNIITLYKSPNEYTINYLTCEQAKETFDKLLEDMRRQDKITMH